MKIGPRITRFRQARGLTKSALARRARVGRITLVRLENKNTTRQPTLATLDRIAKALGVTMCDLIAPTSALSGEVRRLLGLKRTSGLGRATS